jgi:hypothetical protein
MSGMFMLLQKYPFDGKRQIRLSTLSKLTTGNAFRLQWYQNHSNFHCYCYHRVFFLEGGKQCIGHKLRSLGKEN